MLKKKKKLKIFETRYFGLIIGIFVILIIFGLSRTTTIFSGLETSMLDVHFKYKTISEKENIQEGVSLEAVNPNISPDIVIVGIV